MQQGSWPTITIVSGIAVTLVFGVMLIGSGSRIASELISAQETISTDPQPEPPEPQPEPIAPQPEPTTAQLEPTATQAEPTNPQSETTNGQPAPNDPEAANFELTAGWLAVATAFVVAVVPLVAFGSAAGRVFQSGSPGPNPAAQNQAAQNQAAQNQAAPGGAQQSTALASREPVLTTATVVAIAQAFLITTGWNGNLSEGTLTALVVGTTAFAGLFLRGRVKAQA